MRKTIITCICVLFLSSALSIKSESLYDFAIKETRKVNELVRKTYKYLYQAIFHCQDAKSSKKTILQEKITHPDNKIVKKTNEKTTKIIKHGEIKTLVEKEIKKNKK